MGQSSSRCCRSEGNGNNTTLDALVQNGDAVDSGNSSPTVLGEDVFKAIEDIKIEALGEILLKYDASEVVANREDLSDLYTKILGMDAYCSSFYEKGHEAIYSDWSADEILRAIDAWYDDLMFGIDIHMHQGTQLPHIEKPFRELFLQSLMCHMTHKEVALLLLQSTECPIASALIGYGMLKKLALIANRENEYELEGKSTELAEKLESIAVETINSCYKKDIEKGLFLVIRSLPEWNNSTLMSIAEAANSKRFMATNACQARLTQIWNGYFYYSNTPSWKLWLSSVLPPLALQQRNHVVEQKKNVSNWPSWKECKYDKDPWYPTTKNILRRGLNEDRFGCSAPLWFLYSTPRVKLITNSISYVIYLCLFAYFANTNLAPLDKQNPSIEEYLVWIWSIAMVFDELRQVFSSRAQYARNGWRLYLISGWNKFDMTCHLLMIISIVLRLTLTGDNFYVARVFYAMTLLLSCLRILHIFYASPSTGPLIVMIKAMLADLLKFMAVLLVFILAFGVAMRSLKYPNVSPSWKLLIDIIYEPYWNIYGEMFSGEDNKVMVPVIQENCTYNETLHRLMPDIYPRCPEDSSIATILFVIYMAIVNILLLNLLIAILNHTYEKIKQESQILWKFYRYQFVSEYYDKPALPPPFILFVHVYMISKFILMKYNQKSTNTFVEKKNNAFYHDLNKGNPDLSNSELSSLARLSIVRVMENIYEEERHDGVNLAKTISQLQCTVDTVKGEIREIKKCSASPAATYDSSSAGDINRRLTSVEEGFKGVNSRIVALDSKLDIMLRILDK